VVGSGSALSSWEVLSLKVGNKRLLLLKVTMPFVVGLDNGVGGVLVAIESGGTGDLPPLTTGGAVGDTIGDSRRSMSTAVD
jgi:hypothetical protein